MAIRLRDFVIVRDMDDANIQVALTPEARGFFNIGSSTRITINELARLTKDISTAQVALLNISTGLASMS